MANYFPLIANTTSSQIQEIPVGSLLDLSQSGIANSGNIAVTGVITATGNITSSGNISGTYILGNGAFLTGIVSGSTYSNSNVAAYLPTYTGNLVSLTGNIITTANITAAYVLPQSNATTDLGSNTLQWRSLYVSNNTIYIGGVSVGIADGQLTVAGNTVVTEGTSLTGNIETTGNILAGNLEVTRDAVILGNLRVQGNTTYINVSDLIVEDKDIIVGANASATLSDLNGAGLQIGNISAGGNITFFYNSTSNTMALSHGANIANTVGVTGNINASGNISGSYLLGNGSQLTGISSGGATIADDTTTNSNYYPVFATATSGSLTTATISSTKLTFNPSSGTLTATDVNTSSDRNFKKNVKNIKSALSKINSIQGVSFKWKETGNKSYGIIAQDLIQVLPELVHSEERGLTVSYLPLIAILIEAIKEQQQQIDQLKNTKPS